MKRWLVPLAIGMVVLYAALAIGAAGCVSLDSGQPSSTHHHSPSHVAHSPLCAWACQANSTVYIHIAAPLIALFAFVLMLWLIGVIPSTALFATFFHSRAPPR